MWICEYGCVWNSKFPTSFASFFARTLLKLLTGTFFKKSFYTKFAQKIILNHFLKNSKYLIDYVLMNRSVFHTYCLGWEPAYVNTAIVWWQYVALLFQQAMLNS